MRLKHWLQRLPRHVMLSHRKRVVKMRCERLSVRLLTEIGSDAVNDIIFKDVSTMGAYGLCATDVRDTVTFTI